MRYLVIATAFLVLAICSMSDSARAVGYDTAGKERCVCSPLVARGIYPDMLNNLKEALVLPRLGFLAERLALEVKAILGQFGIRSQGDPRGSIEPTKGILGQDIGLPENNRRLAESKTGKKKREKTRRVKLPPRSL